MITKDAKWHKKHMKKLKKNKLRQKLHTSEFRLFRGDSIARQNAEEGYKAAIAREKEIIVTRSWLYRQWLKFRNRIKILLIKLKHHGTQTQED